MRLGQEDELCTQTSAKRKRNITWHRVVLADEPFQQTLSGVREKKKKCFALLLSAFFSFLFFVLWLTFTIRKEEDSKRQLNTQTVYQFIEFNLIQKYCSHEYTPVVQSVSLLPIMRWLDALSKYSVWDYRGVQFFFQRPLVTVCSC